MNFTDLFEDYKEYELAYLEIQKLGKIVKLPAREWFRKAFVRYVSRQDGFKKDETLSEELSSFGENVVQSLNIIIDCTQSDNEQVANLSKKILKLLEKLDIMGLLEYHKELMTMIDKESPVKVVHDFGDGYQIVQFNRLYAQREVGRIMGNCIRDTDSIQKKLYVLLRNGTPRVAFKISKPLLDDTVTLSDCEGFSYKPAEEIFWPMIVAFGKKKGVSKWPSFLTDFALSET